MVKVVGGVVTVGRNFIVFKFNRYTALPGIDFYHDISLYMESMQKNISKETNKKNMWPQNPDKSFTPGQVGQLGVIYNKEKEYREANGF